MKLYKLILLALLLSLSCCKNESELDSNEKSAENSIICKVKPMEFDNNEDGLSTRSSLTFDTTEGMLFSWVSKDELAVFPGLNSDSRNYGIFTLKEEDNNSSPVSHFESSGFSLTKDATYYAFSKSPNTAPSSTETGGVSLNIDSKQNIIASYAGQTQINDNNSDHLGKYDYMAAAATATGTDVAYFEFQHLGLTAFFDITFNESINQTFTELQLYEAGQDEFKETTRSINLTSGTGVGADYAPAWFEPEITSSSQRFSLTLKTKDTNDNTTDGITVKGNSLKLFMELPPFDFSSKTLVGHLKASNPNSLSTIKDYYFTVTGKKFRANSARWLTLTAYPCTQYKINLQLIQDWEKGNVVEQTRSTGDPGNEETLDLPQYLYAYFINNGHVVQTATASGNDISWEVNSSNNRIYDYVGSWTFTGDKTPEDSKTLALDNSYGTTPKVYVIASKTSITPGTITVGDDGTSEEDLLKFVYSYTGHQSNTETDVTKIQSANQDFIKNLYSTPYAEGSAFTGYLSGTDVKDVKLYHVASKVDVDWENNKTTTTGSVTVQTPLSGSVSINNFQTTDLSYFKPTTGNTGSGDGSVTESINTGNAYNGRTYWYLPQPSNAKYNVTIGSTTQDITFTPDPVYTSWFRGKITIK